MLIFSSTGAQINPQQLQGPARGTAVTPVQPWHRHGRPDGTGPPPDRAAAGPGLPQRAAPPSRRHVSLFSAGEGKKKYPIFNERSPHRRPRLPPEGLPPEGLATGGHLSGPRGVRLALPPTGSPATDPAAPCGGRNPRHTPHHPTPGRTPHLLQRQSPAPPARQTSAPPP